MNDFKFFDFINNLEVDDSENTIEDIEYLVKKISVIERKCKVHQDFVFRTFITKDNSENDEYNNNTCRDISLYNEIKAKENFKSSSKNIPNNNQDSSKKGEEEDIQIDKQDDTEPVLKKLLDKVYRKIAVKFHPDKNRSASTSIFESANKAHKSKNLSQLIYIMKMGKIELQFNTSEMEFINNEKNKLEKKFTELKSSIFYKWDSLEQSVKDRYVDYLKKINGITS